MPVRAFGRAGGLYYLGDLRPDPRNPLFPSDDPCEGLLRSMVPSARRLARRHLAIQGSGEDLAPEVGPINAQMRAVGATSKVEVVPGDHITALRPALQILMERIEAGEI